MGRNIFKERVLEFSNIHTETKYLADYIEQKECEEMLYAICYELAKLSDLIVQYKENNLEYAENYDDLIVESLVIKFKQLHNLIPEYNHLRDFNLIFKISEFFKVKIAKGIIVDKLKICIGENPNFINKSEKNDITSSYIYMKKIWKCDKKAAYRGVKAKKIDFVRKIGDNRALIYSKKNYNDEIMAVIINHDNDLFFEYETFIYEIDRMSKVDKLNAFRLISNKSSNEVKHGHKLYLYNIINIMNDAEIEYLIGSILNYETIYKKVTR
jgi:hypothetical protein